MPLMIKEEFLKEVRETDLKLKNARITSVEIVKAERRIRYVFICDNFIDDELQKKVWLIAKKHTPEVFLKVNVIFKKIVSNEELINAEIFKYVSANFPSVSVLLNQSDIRSAAADGMVKYVIKLSADGAEYMAKFGGFNKLNDYLAKKFCSDFSGSAEIRENKENYSLLTEEVYRGRIEKINYRTIKVEKVIPIDDPNMSDVAIYIEDVTSGNAVVCGKITDIEERTTKTGKPFFIIHLDDTTGRTSGVYFSKKNTLDKIRALSEGDCIIVSGTIGEYNGRSSFTIDKINACSFPENFVKKDRYKKPVPKNYSLVFPQKASTVEVKSVFDEEGDVPAELKEKEYVVFDIETTGLDVLNNEITEIGAVKITGGKITEQFHTLVKPNGRIPENITELTGITDETVKDAPGISEVLPDFIKFTFGAAVVAQNADFDVSFIKRYAAAEDYSFNNEILDTVVLSRRIVPELHKNDLKTLADYFDITFRHHRALSDAYATAEIFIKLIKLKNSAG